ncbi:MAG: hypothetical protein KME59_10325 [Trichormus sp. ATA11-4-KO1]|nr:hypothetical protein [Trichormus sp. ATA11-4-KO1]
MGRWTPLILMAGGLAILLGTLLGINFPMGGQQSASNNAPGGRTSKVLPANINVNSSAPSRTTNNGTTPERRGGVAQDSFTAPNTPNNRSSVAQNNTSDDSFSSPETTSGTRSTGMQSGTSSSSAANRDNQPIRALW